MSKKNFENFLSAFKEFLENEQEFVVVTLVKKIGAAPQEIGAKAIVTRQGLEYGTVGGGKVEKRAIEQARQMLESNSSCAFYDWNLQKDIGMTCGGVVSFFLERYSAVNPFCLVIFGAGHIAQALIRLLLHLDCRVICFDSREEWLNKLPISPKLKIICTSDLAAQVALLPNKAFVCLMTMGHSSDLPILIEVMKNRERFSYVGNIGSKQKATRLRKDLKEAGISQEKLEAFYCPMGEEGCGNNSPIEIAFSIVAQILKIKKIIG